MISSPIIHIGYPKTGTKWLQKNLFPNLEGCFFLNRPQVFDLLIKPDTFEFSATECKQQIDKLAQGRRVAISEELLLGGLDIGFGVGEFIVTMANRLKSVYSDALIIITLRNQVEAISSVYGHYIKSGGTYSPSSFLGIEGRHKSFYKNHHLFSLKFFEYDRIVNHYMELFGKEKVIILYYEDFLSDQVQFIQEFSRLVGIPTTNAMPVLRFENKRLSSASVKIMRLLNRFTAKNTYFKNYLINIPTLYYRTLSISEKIDLLKWFKDNPYKLPKSIEDTISNYYKASNQRLVSLHGLDRVKTLGYPL